MIGSVFETRDQMLEQLRRREEIAAQQAVAAAVPVAVPAAAPMAAGIPATGYSTAPMALKGAEPEAAKRRKAKDGKRGRDLKGRDLEADPLTGAHEVAQAGDGKHSRKSYDDRGITASRGDTMPPGKPEPEQFARDYIQPGHAAESPMSEGPRENPVPAPSVHRGFPVPIQMSGAPMAAGVPSHVAASYSMGSPSDR